MEKDEAISAAKRFIKQKGARELPVKKAVLIEKTWFVCFDLGHTVRGLPDYIIAVDDETGVPSEFKTL